MLEGPNRLPGAATPPPTTDKEEPGIKHKKSDVENLKDIPLKIANKRYPALKSISNFSSKLFRNYYALKANVSEKWDTIKIEVRNVPGKIKDLMIQTFPNLAKILYSGISANITGTQNLVAELAKNPLKKLVSLDDGQFYITDREVGLPGKAGTSDQSKFAMSNLLKLVEKSMDNPDEVKNLKEMMKNLRESDWAKAVFKNNEELNMQALKIEGQLRTPEEARAMLEDLHKVIHQLSNENNNKLRLEDGSIKLVKRSTVGSTPGQSPEAKLAVRTALTQLQVGIEKGGFTREAIAMLKTLENSEWFQAVLANDPELIVQFDAIKSDLTAKKTAQLEVLEKLFEKASETDDKLKNDLRRGFNEDEPIINILKPLADDDASIMPLDIFALGFNSMMPLKNLLVIAKELHESEGLTEEQKKMIVSFVREIDRLELNAEELNQKENAALFKEITGESPKAVETKKLLQGEDIPGNFAAILSKVLNEEEITPEDIELCANAFQNISVSSFTDLSALKIFTEKEGEGARDQLAEKFNLISAFVVDIIINCNNLEAANKAISFFIKVAKHCEQNNDLNSPQAILAGLGHASVNRLVSIISEEDAATKNELEKLYDGAFNAKAIRSRIADHMESHEHFIPTPLKFFGDLTFAHDGNPNPINRLKFYEKPLDVFQQGRDNARKKEAVSAKPFEKYMMGNVRQGETKKIDDERYAKSLELKPREK